MPNFVNYRPIERSAPKLRNTSFTISGPLDDYLATISSSSDAPEETTSSEVSKETPKGIDFSWRSGGIKETPYTRSSIDSGSQLSNKNNIVNWALSKQGRPYVWGAKGNNDSYDCSGLIYAAYKANGIDVPASTAAWLSSGKQTVGKTEGLPGDVIITGSTNSPSGRHARLITKNLGNGKYECIEAKGKNYGVVTSTYTVGNDLKNIYRAKQGVKLIKRNKQ